MKRAVCLVVCVILAVAGSAGSIYLHGERKISGSQVALGRSAASEIEVWGTVNISTKAKAPANSASFAIVASGDLPAALPDDIATYDSTTAPVLNISDLQIPLIVFQKTPNANPGAFNPIRGFRGFWSPVQGTLAINNESSLAASSATDGAFYDLLRTTYWDGSDRIDFFNPSTPVGNEAQGFWAFQDGRLLGAMQILNDGEVDVFTASQPGKAAFTRKIPGLVTVLLPRDDSNTWR